MIYITVLSPQVHIVIVWWVSFLNLWLRQASLSCVCILPPPSSFFFSLPPSTLSLPCRQCSVIVWGCSSIVLLFCLVTGSCCVAQASLELGILLLQPPKHWTCGLVSLLSDAVPQVLPFRFLCSCCIGTSFYLGSKEDCPSPDSWLCSNWRKRWGSIALSLVNAYSWIYIHCFECYSFGHTPSFKGAWECAFSWTAGCPAEMFVIPKGKTRLLGR